MNKVYGLISGYSPVRFDRTRTIISYGMEAVDETHATWYEIYYYKRQIPIPSLQMIKDDVINEIDAQTEEKIRTEFQWTLTKGWKLVSGQKVDLTGQTVNVWLSDENQSNYSEGHSIAKDHPEQFLPISYKVSEDEDKVAIYEDFEDFATLDNFYLAAAAFKKAKLNEGWQKKDSINWNDYVIPAE